MTIPNRPTLPSNTPPTPDVTYHSALRLREPLTPPAALTTLPADVQGQVSQFLTRLTAAEQRYTALSEGFTRLWEQGQYPVDYRRAQAQALLTQTFTDLDADLQAAADHLAQARDMARKGMRPSLLGSPDVHELKLLNAREEVKTALEGLQPTEQRRVLVELFDDAMTDDPRSALAYFIGGTDAYKRLLKDPATRAQFAAQQPAMLRRLLPPSAEPYLNAGAVLDELHTLLETAQTVRHFTMRDNAGLL